MAMRIKNGMRPVHSGEVLREDFLPPAGLTALLHQLPDRLRSVGNHTHRPYLAVCFPHGHCNRFGMDIKTDTS
jgi:hypothetical protein